MNYYFRSFILKKKFNNFSNTFTRHLILSITLIESTYFNKPLSVLIIVKFNISNSCFDLDEVKIKIVLNYLVMYNIIQYYT